MNFIRNHHKNKSDRINSTTDTEHMFRSLNDHIHTLKGLRVKIAKLKISKAENSQGRKQPKLKTDKTENSQY
mgnify:CR=1 FL=1